VNGGNAGKGEDDKPFGGMGGGAMGGAMGGGGSNPFAVSQQQPKPMARQGQAQPSQTFAQMQQSGQARPAPAPAGGGAQLGQAFQSSGQSNTLLQQLQGQLGAMGGRSTYDDPGFQQRRAAAMGNLEAERKASETDLNEEMARRGLAASSIASGRLGDIAGQFGRAQATLDADLTKEAMSQEQQRQQFVAQQTGQLFGQVSGNELNAFGLSTTSAKAGADIDMEARRLVQEASLRGRELSLTEARDIASAENQRGQLGLGYAEMGSREKMQQNQFGFEGEQSALERGLREAMQTRELTGQEKRQLVDIENQRLMQGRDISAQDRRQSTQIGATKDLQLGEQTFQGAQSQFERDLRAQLQAGQITAEGARQLAQINANKALQTDSQTFQSGENVRSNTFQAEQSKLERDLRSTLSGDSLAAAKAQFDKQFGLDTDRFGADKAAAQNQFLGSLASVLAPMDPAKRKEFLASLGIKTPTAVSAQVAAPVAEYRDAGDTDFGYRFGDRNF
jgi:hypothetical protein